MRFTRPALVLVALCAVLGARSASAANDPCRVLTAEAFSRIMGYTATVDKTGSTAMSCFYKGPSHSGGQFTILTETASGPGAPALLKGGPPPGSGLIGGAFRQGSIIFSVSIRSADKTKLEALVAEIKRNLK